jgi:predicted metal-dependent hydrolase
MKAFVQLALDWLDPKPVLVDAQDAATNAPALALNEVLLAAEFVHPKANRSIDLGSSKVAYCLSRSKRSTIGMSVGPDGLDVRAPCWVGLGAVEAVLLEKAAWIVRKLQEVQERQQHMQATIIEWRQGARVPFLGDTLVLDLNSERPRDSSLTRLHSTEGVEKTLRVSVAQAATPAQIREAVQAWLMQQAKANFMQRLDHFAPQLGVRWKKLSLSNASTRWGTAGADGAIRLNWRLIHFKQDIIDYVVVHELSHLRVMNHSPLFWDTVRTVVPDYAQRRAQLKDEALPRWA